MEIQSMLSIFWFFFQKYLLRVSNSQNEITLIFLFKTSSLPIESVKRKIIRNLRVLENQGLVTSKNNYQDIVNAIAKVWSDLLSEIERSTSPWVCRFVLGYS